MEFSIPPELESRLDEISAFIETHVYPAERRFAEHEAHLDVIMQPIRDAAKAAGLWMPQIPKRDGGMGLGLMEHALVSERLGRSPLGNYALNCQAPDAGNMEILLEYGSRSQKQRWLTPLLAGEIRSCFSMTEPERAGSNPIWLGTTATRDGEGWVINGRKWFTTAADGAAFSIVMAVTDPEAPPHKRASMFIVPTDAPGFSLVRNIPIMGDVGEGWASHAEVAYDDVRVGDDALLGFPGAGFFIAQARLGPGRVHHCMRWMGICERAFGMMCERAATRELAPGEYLGQRQTIQNWIAESRAEIDSTRLLVLHAAWRIDAVGAKAAQIDIAAIKFHAAQTMLRVVDRAIQTHGALGITDDTVLSFFYRHERGARIYDGPDEVHKSSVARKILERYGLSRRRGTQR